MNETRHKTYCDKCGKPIYTSAAMPKSLCAACSSQDSIDRNSGELRRTDQRVAAVVSHNTSR